MDKNSEILSLKDVDALSTYLYESPIRIVMTKLGSELDNDIFKAVYKAGIDVDPDELRKAIEYDRNQFSKGFRVGWDAREKGMVHCKDCKHRPKGTGANHDLEFPDSRCPCSCEGDPWYSWKPDDDWFCANGEREPDYDDD